MTIHLGPPIIDLIEQRCGEGATHQAITGEIRQRFGLLVGPDRIRRIARRNGVATGPVAVAAVKPPPPFPVPKGGFSMLGASAEARRIAADPALAERVGRIRVGLTVSAETNHTGEKAHA